LFSIVVIVVGMGRGAAEAVGEIGGGIDCRRSMRMGRIKRSRKWSRSCSVMNRD
jgi:hypothetical protein